MKKQQLYYITYSSPTRYSVWVSKTKYLVQSHLSEGEAKKLINSLTKDCEEAISKL
jgi:hypothetical protein